LGELTEEDGDYFGDAVVEAAPETEDLWLPLPGIGNPVNP
jgi:hypothetical protein